MKKLIALLLAALMLLGVCCALAEEVLDYTLTADSVPEGYELETPSDDCIIFYSDAKGLMIIIGVEPSEEFEGYTLEKNLTDEQKAQMEALFAQDYAEPVFDYSRETKNGTPLILVDENDIDEGDIMDIFTIYDGYFVSCSVLKLEGSIGENDIADAIEALSVTWVVDK